MDRIVLKRYTKKELAVMYFPDSSPETARHHLMDWIKKCAPLSRALARKHYVSSQRYFSSEQVGMIFRYLGEP